VEFNIVLKCQVCGNEVDLPFQCSYCQAYFCNEHRLPENHQCPDLPKEPLFWYQKRKIAKKRVPTYPSTFPSIKQRRGSTVAKTILALGIIVLTLGVGLMIFPQSFHEEGEFVFQSLGRPVSAFDLGVIPKNVEIRVDYNVKEDSYGLSEGNLYVILINASELFVIDRAWNSRPALSSLC